VTTERSLVELRLHAGFQSQAILAKQIDIHVSSVALWEAGKRRIPAKHVDQLARLYKLTPADIIRACKLKPRYRKRRRGRPRPGHLDPRIMIWQWDEDEWLEKHAGTMPLPDLTLQCNSRFAGRHPPRSKDGIEKRARELGCSIEWYEGLSLQRLKAMVRWNVRDNSRAGHRGGSMVETYWINTGLLKARLVYGRGRTKGLSARRWQILESDFLEFLKEHPYAYDWRRFEPGSWRQRAEMIAKRSPWKSLDEFLEITGMSRRLWRKHADAIPHKLRFHCFGGLQYRNGEPMIHIDDITSFKSTYQCRRGGRWPELVLNQAA